MSTDRLIRFVELHQFAAHLTPDGRLMVVGDVVGPGGVHFAEVVTIEPTLSAVRDWLGY